IELWLTRGADWQGSYASLFYDDEVYAAYINGLLLGRPRTSEPLGITNPGKPPHESLFSIQVVPAYLIVLSARAFGLTAVQAFIGQGRQAWRAAIAAGAVFAVLIFSYFFLWTAAAAWLACFVLVWLVARYSEWPMLVKRLAPTALFGTAALAVYVVLLSHRD